MRYASEGAPSGFESDLRAKDGSNIPVLISASIVYDNKGQKVGTIIFARTCANANVPKTPSRKRAMNWKSGSKNVLPN